MKYNYILWTKDEWHSNSSKELEGVFTSKKALWKYIRGLKKANYLDDEDLKQLEGLNQTQGLNLNYAIEEIEINPKFKNNE